MHLWEFIGEFKRAARKKKMKSTIFPLTAGADLSPAFQDWGECKVPCSVLQVQNWILNVNGFGDQTFSRSSIILIRQSRDTGRAERCSKSRIHQMLLPTLIKGVCWWMGGAHLPPARSLGEWRQCDPAIFFCLLQALMQEIQADTVRPISRIKTETFGLWYIQ